MELSACKDDGSAVMFPVPGQPLWTQLYATAAVPWTCGAGISHMTQFVIVAVRPEKSLMPLPSLCATVQLVRVRFSPLWAMPSPGCPMKEQFTKVAVPELFIQSIAAIRRKPTASNHQVGCCAVVECVSSVSEEHAGCQGQFTRGNTHCRAGRVSNKRATQ
jgi:hypothetical protein